MSGGGNDYCWKSSQFGVDILELWHHFDLAHLLSMVLCMTITTVLISLGCNECQVEETTIAGNRSHSALISWSCGITLTLATYHSMALCMTITTVLISLGCNECQVEETTIAGNRSHSALISWSCGITLTL